MSEEKIISNFLDLRQHSRSAFAEIVTRNIPETWKEGRYGSAAMETLIAVADLGFAVVTDTVAFLPKVGVRAINATVNALDNLGKKSPRP